MKKLFAAALFGLVGFNIAAAQNLIPDPTFSSGVSGWTVRAPDFTTRVDWNDGAGADGAPGFASMVGFRGPGAAFATICLPVEAGTSYSWGGFLRQPMPSSTEFDLVFYAGSSCDGQFLLQIFSPPVGSNADPSAWYLRSGQDIVAPPLAVSVAFEVELNTAAATPGNSFSVDFDNVYFGRQGTGPPTETVAVPTLSTSAFLLLTAALAAAAVWRLTRR
jgi:hypothetical protein